MLITSAAKAAATMGEKIDAVLETLAFSDDTQIVLGKQPEANPCNIKELGRGYGLFA